MTTRKRLNEKFNIGNLPEHNVSAIEHKKRSENNLNSGKLFKESVEECLKLGSFNNWDCVLKFPKNTLYAFDSRYANLQNGAVNTLEKSACGLFVAYNLLKNFYHLDIDFLEFKIAMEQKGYRQWNIPGLKNAAGRPVTLNEPTVNLETLKNKFTGNNELQKCNSLNEVYSKFGNPFGIGISAFFIDNVIKLVFNDNNIDIADDTRIKSVEHILEVLESGYPILMRVNNAIYHDDPNRGEGHYVTVLGFSNGMAYIFDTSIENEVIIPIERLLKASIANVNTIFVWNTNPNIRKK